MMCWVCGGNDDGDVVVVMMVVVVMVCWVCGGDDEDVRGRYTTASKEGPFSPMKRINESFRSSRTEKH